MVRFVLWFLGFVVVVLGGLWLFQRRLIYFPAQRGPPIGGVPGGWQEIAYETSDGLMLNAWIRPPDPGAAIVVVFNGNAGNRAGRVPLGNALAAEGYGVLLTDYRGYGGNPGHPTESGLGRDARAAVAWAREHASGHPVVYFGESLGAAVAVGLAVAEPPDALVLRSPFTSLTAVGRTHYPFLPVGLLLRDEYPVREQIGKVSASMLVVAGSSDSIVPTRQSREVFDAALEPKTWVLIDGADHNDAALTDGPEIVDAVARFLAEVIP